VRLLGDEVRLLGDEVRYLLGGEVFVVNLDDIMKRRKIWVIINLEKMWNLLLVDSLWDWESFNGNSGTTPLRQVNDCKTSSNHTKINKRNKWKNEEKSNEEEWKRKKKKKKIEIWEETYVKTLFKLTFPTHE
jgi:hypothetical protein